MDLNFIAKEIDASPNTYKAFDNDPEQFDHFFQFINGGTNVVLLEPTTTIAMSQLRAGSNSLAEGETQKAVVRQLLPH